MRLRFESTLRASPEEAWAWATSVAGVSAELRPLLRMTAPRGVEDLIGDVPPLGRPLFRSYVFLFGVVPFDRSDLTLVEFEPGRRFLEESPMLSLKLWRHERTIVAAGEGSSLTDQLEFEPRFAKAITAWFIRTIFTHRHAVLRRELG